MAQKTLNAFVVIGGKVDNSFGQIGTALIAMGQTVDEISTKLINFGKKSIEVYKDYEYNLGMVEGIWGSNGTFAKGSKEMADALAQLDTAATEWAANTIFHTNDISNAFVEAARGGWSIYDMLDGMPYVMRMAQSGDMDLSTSLNYVLKSMKSLGLEFSQLPEFTDMWIYSANRSAGTAKEFGDTMLKMGSSMRFAKNPAELLTLTKIMHDMGAEGSEAGTLIRNGMLSIYAPSGIASKVMEKLGATNEEIKGIMEDSQKLEAFNLLEGAGFSAFDENGRAKGVLETFNSLGEILANISGGWDNINENETAMGVLSNIFGKRGATGALNIITAIHDGLTGLYDELENGAAKGAAEYVSEVMGDTLWGKVELFESKVERLHQVVGQNLAPQLESIAGSVGKVIDKMSAAGTDNGISAGLDMAERFAKWIGDTVDDMGDLDPAAFDGLTSALGAVATLGGGLTISGSVLRFMGYVFGTPAGGVALTAMAIASIAESVNKMREVDFAQTFGDMKLDTTPLNASLTAIHDDFTTATEGITKFNTALQESVTNYNKVSQTFSSKMLTDMLTGTTLTETDLEQYRSWGDQMIGAVKEGMFTSYNKSAEFWKWMFSGNDETGEELQQNTMFTSILKFLQDDYDQNIGELNALGENFQRAIDNALLDFEISPEEYDNIKSYFHQLNDAIARAQAEAQSEQDYVKRALMFDKGQNLSYTDMMDYIQNTIEPQRQAELDYATEQYKTNLFKMRYRYEKDYAAAETDEERRAVDNKYNQYEGISASEGIISFDAYDAEMNRKIAEISKPYDQEILDMMGTALNESDISEADKYFGAIASTLNSGIISGGLAEYMLESSEYAKKKNFFNPAEMTGVEKGEKYYSEQVNALGGRNAIRERITAYEESGDTETAARLQSVIDKFDLLTAHYDSESLYASPEKDRVGLDEAREIVEGIAQSGTGVTPEFIQSLAAGVNDTDNALTYWQGELDSLNSRINKYEAPDRMSGTVSARFDWKDYKAPEELYERREYIESRIDSLNVQRQSYLSGNAAMSPEAHIAMAAADIEPAMSPVLNAIQNYIAGLKPSPYIHAGAPGSAYEKKMEMETTQISTDLEITNAGEAASAARSVAQAEFSNPLDVLVGFGGAISAAQSTWDSINSIFGKTITQTVHIVTQGSATPGMAEGGRAIEPVLFAEAGPEWFIPERHDKRTANLIAMAAHASGYSLMELATMHGAKAFADGGLFGGSSMPNVSELQWSTLDYSDSGGSNSNSSGDSTTFQVHYSPVIHADNADGVTQTLREDKKRLKKVLKELMEEQDLYESVVTYR